MSCVKPRVPTTSDHTFEMPCYTPAISDPRKTHSRPLDIRYTVLAQDSCLYCTPGSHACNMTRVQTMLFLPLVEQVFLEDELNAGNVMQTLCDPKVRLLPVTHSWCCSVYSYIRSPDCGMLRAKLFKAGNHWQRFSHTNNDVRHCYQCSVYS